MKFLTSKYPGLDGQSLGEIVEKKEKNHFELACRSLFEKSHPEKHKGMDFVKGVGRQPNMYFYQSEKYYEGIGK